MLWGSIVGPVKATTCCEYDIFDKFLCLDLTVGCVSGRHRQFWRQIHLVVAAAATNWRQLDPVLPRLVEMTTAALLTSTSTAVVLLSLHRHHLLHMDCNGLS